MALLQYALLAISASILCRFCLLPSFFSPLAAIPPAHWSARFSSLWILWARFNKRENWTIHDAHQRLGPIVRLGPEEVSVNDVQALKTIYVGGWEKPEWYLLFTNFWGYVYNVRFLRLGGSLSGLDLTIEAFPTCSLCCDPKSIPGESVSLATSTQSHICSVHPP